MKRVRRARRLKRVKRKKRAKRARRVKRWKKVKRMKTARRVKRKPMKKKKRLKNLKKMRKPRSLRRTRQKKLRHQPLCLDLRARSEDAWKSCRNAWRSGSRSALRGVIRERRGGLRGARHRSVSLHRPFEEVTAVRLDNMIEEDHKCACKSCNFNT